jgi:hypothetical protein
MLAGRRLYASWLLASTALLLYLCYLFARGVFVA